MMSNPPTNTGHNITNSTTSTLATSTEVTATEPEDIDPKYTELDLTKLPGKDRLYTAEEGRYENLSEEEQAVLIEAYHCRDYKNDGKQACKHHAEIYGVQIEDARLVALRDGVAVVYGPSGAEMKGWLYIYDLVEREIVAKIIDVGNVAIGSDFIIYANDSGKESRLELYKPGMKDFINITDSEIDTHLQTHIQISYLEYKDSYYHPIFPVDFIGETITVYRHTYNYTEIEDSFNEEGLYTPRHVKRELISKTPKTFNLSNIP